MKQRKPLLVNHGAMIDAAPSSSQVFDKNLKKLLSGNGDHIASHLGFYQYPGRALGITEPQDIIQLDPQLLPNWEWILMHFERVGLTHTRNVIWDDDFSYVKVYPEHELSVFYFGSHANDANPDKEWFDITKTMNGKNEFINFCKNFQVPVPKTFCFQTKDEVINPEQFPYPCFLKISRSVSGLGIVKCENIQKLEKELMKLERNIHFQIQEVLEDAVFINIQYKSFGNGNYERFLITEQILDGFEHNGNVYPAGVNYSLITPLTDKIAKYLSSEGMKGYFAFDFGVINNSGIYAIECNPRFNGATYPSIIADKLGIKKWMSKNYQTKKRKLKDIYLGVIEYNALTNKGVIIYNWGPIVNGRISAILAGDNLQRKEIEEKLLEIL